MKTLPKSAICKLWVVFGTFFLPIGSAIASLTPGWTPFLTIQNIVIQSDGALLSIQGGIPATYLRDDCNGSGYSFIDLTTTSGKAQLAVALTAFTQGRQVMLALQACNGGRPAITHMQM